MLFNTTHPTINYHLTFNEYSSVASASLSVKWKHCVFLRSHPFVNSRRLFDYMPLVKFSYPNSFSLKISNL